MNVLVIKVDIHKVADVVELPEGYNGQAIAGIIESWKKKHLPKDRQVIVTSELRVLNIDYREEWGKNVKIVEGGTIKIDPNIKINDMGLNDCYREVDYKNE